MLGRLIRSIVLCNQLLTAAMPVAAMEYRKMETGNGSSIVLQYGPIVEGDTLKLSRFISDMPSARIFGFALHSPGGDIDEAYRMALFLRGIHALTIVGVHNICAAACFLPFSVGRIKLVYTTSKIIVHGTASPDGLDNIAALEATNKIVRYASQLGVPQSIIRKMVVMPPGRIEPLSRSNLLAIGAEFPADEKP
jgi:hypothetical protein